jgi:hypothetical protein
MDVQTSTPPELKVTILTANGAKAYLPENCPEYDRKLFKKVMLYTFHSIEQRAKVGYKYMELGLTGIPRLEERRMKILKRLGYSIREHEFSLFTSWE